MLTIRGAESHAGARPEIYALGLRNPFRFSFAPNGDLVLPDVGESTWEEVNVGSATATPAATTLAGANLGWPNCEGKCEPPNSLYFDPLFQYAHSVPAETTGCAIIGGYVVRDPSLTGLTERYLYGDHCRPDLRTLDLASPGADPQPAGFSIPKGGGELLSFGEDGRGCVYAITEVTAYRVAPSPTAGTACPERPAAGTAGGAGSATAPDRLDRPEALAHRGAATAPASHTSGLRHLRRGLLPACRRGAEAVRARGARRRPGRSAAVGSAAAGASEHGCC